MRALLFLLLTAATAFAQYVPRYGGAAIDLSGRKLLDENGQWSVEWGDNGRHLTNESDTDIFTWSGSAFSLNDGSNNPVLTGNRLFYDSAAHTAFNGETRRLYASDGSTVILDWSASTGITFGTTAAKVRDNLGVLGARTTAQFDKTNSTLADVTGLSVNVTAGKAYAFRARLFTTLNADAGFNTSMGGTATATSFIEVVSWVNTTDNIARNSKITTLGGAFSDAGYDVVMIEIQGTIVVNAGGTLTVKFAQAVTDAGQSSVLAGSTLTAQEIP